MIISLVAFMALQASAQVDSTKGVPITFVFTHTLQAGETGVGINGTFNNWGFYNNRHPYQMQNVGNNTWEITVPLTPDTTGHYTKPGGSGNDGPGVYEYKFVTYNISGGDTTIAGWFPDPLDPLQNAGNNNNSILYVTDPAIYDLTPLSGSTINNKSPVVSARIVSALSSKLVVSSIKLTINGVPVSNSPSYFDSTAGTFSYRAPSPLLAGKYSVVLSAMNNEGSVGIDSSIFDISNAIVLGNDCSNGHCTNRRPKDCSLFRT